MREDPKLADWDYIRPRVITQSLYSDGPRSGHFPDETLPPQDSDEERPLDALSLHTIDEDAPAPVFRRSTTLSPEMAMPERLLGPRFLCYLDETQPRGYRTFNTKDWAKAYGADGTADYIFVSYTRRQFYTLIAGDPSLPAERNVTLQKAADRDTATLVDFAIRASRAANVSAFWIDYECVQPEGGERAEDSMEDVYRICDIVRSAHSLAIVTGPALLPNYEHDGDEALTTKADWLHDWGRRLWTVPEALLCPAEHRIAVYAVGSPTPEHVAKRNLASRVWDDAGALRQLVDHYESSLPLTQLELISIALECLQRRQTEKRRNGDVAYALMGLLRQRPKVVKKDSDFQAFARLSLANDSNMLLERLICLKPSTLDAPWHNMRDTWKARLWDIYPLCQVSEIVGKDTIMLGGARGAVINWSNLHAVDFHAISARPKAWLMVRSGSAVMIPLLSCICFLWIFLSVMSTLASPRVPDEVVLMLYAPFAVFIAFAFCLALWVPALLKQLYSREIHEAQARFFGIEGCPDLEEAEKHIFGQAKNRIKWVSPSNPGQPASDVRGPPPIYGESARQFTLIDTLTLSAIAFEARRPPNVVIACGRERGFVRSVLCSYDVSSNTFIKEGVMRMSTTTLDRMPKMDMFRFTLSSADHGPEVTA